MDVVKSKKRKQDIKLCKNDCQSNDVETTTESLTIKQESSKRNILKSHLKNNSTKNIQKMSNIDHNLSKIKKPCKQRIKGDIKLKANDKLNCNKENCNTKKYIKRTPTKLKKQDTCKQIRKQSNSTNTNSNLSFDLFINSFINSMHEYEQPPAKKSQIKNKRIHKIDLENFKDIVARDTAKEYSESIHSAEEFPLLKNTISSSDSFPDLYIETAVKLSNKSLTLSDSHSSVIVTPIPELSYAMPQFNHSMPNILDANFADINETNTSEIDLDRKSMNIYNWIVTGPELVSESSEKNIEEGLKSYIKFIHHSLNLFRGPIHPSHLNLYRTLMQLENVLSKYLKRD